MPEPEEEATSFLIQLDDPLMNLVLDYGEATARAATASARGNRPEAQRASRDGFRLLTEMFDLRDTEHAQIKRAPEA
ncbi:hypothetical protein [Micromonospora sp. NBC_01796]|uniref:hypothetical protein n=1 Tax=Micromonospora sp. NBC_01796 TaxID=2975987 RepID=UPI002DD7C486|nr:hypothetical protein [Micromonospora sp. NBC_01796]WSA88365.1 hypothetical protein OIE47_12565 [Micromonospora sp. NBC_01796]